MAQSPESARFDSMPRSVISAAGVDAVLPPEELASRVLGLTQGRAARIPGGELLASPQIKPALQRLFECLLQQAGVPVVECPEAVDGMGLSLAAGVQASADAAGWVIALADMPFVAPDTVRRVATAVAAGGSIVAPVYRGERGHPVGFGSDLGPALAALRGDEGARTVVSANRDRLLLLPVDDAGILRDIDRPSDLDAPA
jgi:CTP:molybdopterin cytidylyltransferase MocA